jgi:peptidoglycan/xylan/chitin deacetylase (PgdA/CDA1 family)
VGEREAFIRRAIRILSVLPRDVRARSIHELMKIDNCADSYPDVRLLDWDMINAMSKIGLFTFGSHSHSHLALDSLSESELSREISDSRQSMEEHMSSWLPSIAFPWGRYNATVIKKVKENGYTSALRLTNKPNHHGEDLFKLRRLDAGYLSPSHGYDEGAMIAELAGIGAILR